MSSSPPVAGVSGRLRLRDPCAASMPPPTGLRDRPYRVWCTASTGLWRKPCRRRDGRVAWARPRAGPGPGGEAGPLHGDLGVHVRPAALRAVERQRAVERGDAVREPAQPRSARGVGAADAVVGDLDAHAAVGPPHDDAGPRGPRVLGDVAKYARAARASVVVRRSNGRVSVEVSTTASAARRRARIGAARLADRVAAPSTHAVARQPEGRGTHVHAEIPSSGPAFGARPRARSGPAQATSPVAHRHGLHPQTS